MADQYYKCPKCNSFDFDTDSMEFDGDYGWRVVVCNSCGFEWQEVYQFDHNETTDGSCDELDDNGDAITEITS